MLKKVKSLFDYNYLPDLKAINRQWRTVVNAIGEIEKKAGSREFIELFSMISFGHNISKHDLEFLHFNSGNVFLKAFLSQEIKNQDDVRHVLRGIGMYGLDCQSYYGWIKLLSDIKSIFKENRIIPELEKSLNNFNDYYKNTLQHSANLIYGYTKPKEFWKASRGFFESLSAKCLNYKKKFVEKIPEILVPVLLKHQKISEKLQDYPEISQAFYRKKNIEENLPKIINKDIRTLERKNILKRFSNVLKVLEKRKAGAEILQKEMNETYTREYLNSRNFVSKFELFFTKYEQRIQKLNDSIKNLREFHNAIENDDQQKIYEFAKTRGLEELDEDLGIPLPPGNKIYAYSGISANRHNIGGIARRGGRLEPSHYAGIIESIFRQGMRPSARADGYMYWGKNIYFYPKFHQSYGECVAIFSVDKYCVFLEQGGKKLEHYILTNHNIPPKEVVLAFHIDVFYKVIGKNREYSQTHYERNYYISLFSELEKLKVKYYFFDTNTNKILDLQNDSNFQNAINPKYRKVA